MSWHRNVWLLLPCLLAVFSGCQSAPRTPGPSPDAAVELRNNAASLLYDLLGDEENVSKLLIIKRDRPSLHRVIKDVSATATAARRSLEKMAREDQTLNLKSTALPSGEKAARTSEAKARAGELLRASGPDFEFHLLLMQAEALAYAEHLAIVAAENETSRERAGVFAKISGQMQALHRDVIALLRSPPTANGR